MTPEMINDMVPHAETRDLAAEWLRVRESLRLELGDTVWKSWIEPLQFSKLDGVELILEAPTAFIRDRVNKMYHTRISREFVDDRSIIALVIRLPRQRNGVKSPFVFDHTTRSHPLPAKSVSPAADMGMTHKGVIQPQIQPIQQGDSSLDLDFAMGSVLDPRLTFENFIVGKPNEIAFAAACNIAEHEKPPYNPLFLYGGVGLGKTHLMHAMAWGMRRHTPNRRVIYLSAEKFMYQFVKAIRHKSTHDFKDLFRSVDVLMIDDIQFICGKAATQEEFFHTFNALVDQNKLIIVSADKNPNELPEIEERLRSRLGWGMVADIHPTNYELRLGILHSKLEKITQETPSVQVPDKVLEFLAHRIVSNVRELEGALNRIVAHSRFVGSVITLESTQDALKDLLRANARRLAVSDIQKRVTEYYSLKPGDLVSPSRSRSVTRPRQVAMYLCKLLTSDSLPEIGRKFGNRDHTTVMHAIKKIDEWSETDGALADDVETLKRSLGG